jgi:hypothetical protein
MEKTAEIGEKLRELEGRRQWYQLVDIDGVPSPVHEAWVESRFYNRGKWDNFIAPLLPPARGAFGELGANAGLFLLYAAGQGYDRVIGIEGDDTWFAQMRFVVDHYRMRAKDPYGRIEIQHARVGEPGAGANLSCNMRSSCAELDLDRLPQLEVMLLANVLYWIESRACAAFIDRLAAQCRYALIVSVESRSSCGGPATIGDVREAFSRTWLERGCVPRIDAACDPAARNMFSILFESRSQPDAARRD